MPELPIDIPQSLASYYSHFNDDPDAATERLKKQLKKRGHDAVGHFLLAWFYHLQDNNEQAIEESLKAKNLAPGSPFFKKLHYYLSHPKLFEAWSPQVSKSTADANTSYSDKKGPVLENLDALIEKLSEVESNKISIPQQHQNNAEKSSPPSIDEADEIVSETLAKIHEQQGKIDAAINSYQQLKQLRKDKKDDYEKEIIRLKELKNEQENE